MRKRISKRKWLARFRIGKPVPGMALVEYPELKKRCKPAYQFVYADYIQRGVDRGGSAVLGSRHRGSPV